MLKDVLSTLKQRDYQSLEKLKEFLAIPSISTKPQSADDVRRCATWLCDQLKYAMLDAKVMETRDAAGKPGHPVVVARNKHLPGRPTVLLYGHYDVQPPEPLELWKSPPFEPSVRQDDNGFDAIFARGAVDDKGQVWAHVEAITAWQAHGGLPLNLICLFEGEEEIGSPSLETFIEHYANELRADVCLISDTGMVDRNTPAIEYGLRGLAYAEITLKGPSHDVHSGAYGGAAPNPANVLCQVIASLHDANGRVAIEGFYDDVLELNDQERALNRATGFDEKAWLDGIKIPFAGGDAEYSILERITSRPTLDVNGLTAGYQGAGAKTVIAAQASAKVSMRLVPRQNPEAIKTAFERAVRSRCPKNVSCDIAWFGLAPAVITPIDSDATKLAAQAIEIGFGKKPVFSRGGGTIPVSAGIKRILGCDTLFVGFGLPDDRIHSPNEKFDLEMFRKGTQTAAALYDRLGQLSPTTESVR
jgi:acetylornithine deacetylase/succinyl-diaminopimelate desuccinylase-like protein